MYNHYVIDNEQHPLIKAAEDELARLLQEDAEIEVKHSEIKRKIAGVAQTVETLRKVYGKTDSGLGVFGELMSANRGITDHIREILKIEYPTFLKPTRMKELLEYHGYLKTKDDKDYANPLALVHQILKRLDIAEEIESQALPDGGKWYRWKPISMTASLARNLMREGQPQPPVRQQPQPPPIESIPVPKVDILFSSKGPISPPPDFGKKKK